MKPIGRVALGSIAGGALAGITAPLIRPLFSPVTGGVGAVTMSGYPKGWDYAVIALLAFGAVAGGALAAWRTTRTEESSVETALFGPWPVRVAMTIVFVLMFLMHDRPLDDVDPFHDGEHFTPAMLFHAGERPYRDVFVLHGLATDGGLDALVYGNAPSFRRARRAQTVLDAAAMALLVPIAAELATTTAALIGGVFLSLCGAGALVLAALPYYRLLPLLLATLALLRYCRSGSAPSLFVAFASSFLGLIWSLDTGVYALVGTAGAVVALRVFRLETRPLPPLRVLGLALIAAVLPFVVLVTVRADVGRFLSDSFVVIPAAIDAVWSLPAPAQFRWESVRYYTPPLFYGFMIAVAVLSMRVGRRLDAARLLIVGGMSLVLFRSAAGRAVNDAVDTFGGAHTRFAVPMLGLAVASLIVAPVLRTRVRWMVLVCLVPVILYFEVIPSLTQGFKLLQGWSARMTPVAWRVPYPSPAASSLHTGVANAKELSALAEAIDALGPGTIFDFTNERVLYAMLGRKPPTRCFDVPMLSAPPLLREAMQQLQAAPPVCVILGGIPELAAFDGIPNRDRVPELAAWIDANYPKRRQIGRFTLATR